jgi:uncharacterized repeat protein (TIGR01451 family)
MLLALLVFPHLTRAAGGFLLEASGPEMARPGDQIVYEVRYQNLGWPLLNDVTLVGRVPAHTSFLSASPDCALVGEIVTCYVGALSYGEGGEITVTLRVDENAPIDAVINGKLVAVGREPGEKPIYLNSVRGTTEVVIPSLAVDKGASADLVYSGEPIQYSYAVTNTGDVALTEVTLTDDRKSPSQVCEPVPQLAPGETFTCIWNTALEADTLNVATVVGQDPWADPVTATDSAFVDVVQRPDPGGGGILSLELIASAAEIYAGDTVIYTYTVTNPSDDPVRDISLTDDTLGAIAGPFDLTPGQSAVFTASATLTQDTTNTAVAEGRNLLGDPVRAEDAVSVAVTAPDVSLSLSLTPGAVLVYRGDTVALTYEVTNTGSDTAYQVTLADDLLGTIATAFELAAGAQAGFEVSETVNEDTTFAATATGADRLGKPLEATATAHVDTIQRPDPDGEGILTLSVTPSATNVEAGTVVTYTYVVTNVSQDPVNHVVVADDQFGVVAASGMVQPLDMYEGFTLQGGESRTLTLSLPLYQNTQNVATATGEDLLLTPVSARDDAYVNVWSTAQTEHTVFLPLVLRNGQ